MSADREALSALLGDCGRAGVSLDPGSVVRQIRPHVDVTAAASKDLSRIDPERYAGGVTIGAVSVRSSGRMKLPQGTFVVTSEPMSYVRVGQNTARAIMTGQDGQITHRPALLTVRRLTIPPDAPGNVNVLISKTAFVDQPSQADDDEICVGIEWECDNGASFCFGFVIDPTPIDPPPS